MRPGVALAVLLVSPLAAADPPEGAFAESHVEYIVRLGATWITSDAPLGGGPAPKGYGPALDFEVALRAPNISISAFSTLSTLRARTDTNDQEEDLLEDARFTMLDVGWRVNLHTASGMGAEPFIGVGVAAEVVYESGIRTACQCANNLCSPCTSLYANQPYTSWNLAPLAEIHAGLTLAKTGPVSLDLLALIGWSTNPDGYDADLWSLTTERLAIGGRF